MSAKTRSAKIRKQNKEWAIDLLGGKCVKCSSTSDLEFDHIVQGTRLFSIAGHLNASRTVLVKELQKCQLLCETCHKEKTIFEGYEIAHKLDPLLVIEIKNFIALGVKLQHIADMYDVSYQTIWRIKKGETWSPLKI